MNKMNKHFALKIYFVISLGFLFSLGILLIDYGASFKGTESYGQTLMFERIDPRIMYHEGLVIALGSFLSMTAIAAHELTARADLPPRNPLDASQSPSN